LLKMQVRPVKRRVDGSRSHAQVTLCALSNGSERME